MAHYIAGDGIGTCCDRNAGHKTRKAAERCAKQAIRIGRLEAALTRTYLVQHGVKGEPVRLAGAGW